MLSFFNSLDWNSLREGKHLTLPKNFPSPQMLGFKEPPMALAVGQIRDWVLSLNDGSRLHIHEFPNSEKKIHLDKYDPEKSAAHGILHFLLETWPGCLILFFGTLYVFSKMKVR